MEVTLDDLVDAADAHARRRVVPAGGGPGPQEHRRRRVSQGAGKTTLVRALCAEIDPLEAIGTFETEYELHLHELKRHKIVHPWEARPGSGERGPDGRHGRRVHPRRGARRLVPLQPLPPDRRRGPRQGDLGDDQGDGVRHRAPSPPPTPPTPSRRSASWSPARWRPGRTSPTTLATQQAGRHHRPDRPPRPAHHHGERRSHRRRRVAEIIALDPGERETGYATTHVFAPDRDGTAVPAVLPDEYRALASYGFDLAGYLTQQEVRS